MGWYGNVTIQQVKYVCQSSVLQLYSSRRKRLQHLFVFWLCVVISCFPKTALGFLSNKNGVKIYRRTHRATKDKGYLGCLMLIPMWQPKLKSTYMFVYEQHKSGKIAHYTYQVPLLFYFWEGVVTKTSEWWKIIVHHVLINCNSPYKLIWHFRRRF